MTDAEMELTAHMETQIQERDLKIGELQAQLLELHEDYERVLNLAMSNDQDTRDKFAAAALPQLLPIALARTEPGSGAIQEKPLQRLAVEVYRIADACMQAR